LVDALPRNATGKLPRESLAALARALAPRGRSGAA
jgi:acyl-coenzyme A synthetase/AMP-(fatty) acid ligase